MKPLPLYIYPSKEDLKAKWEKAYEDCKKSTGLAGINFMNAIIYGSEDEKVKSQALCLGLKMRMLDNKGKIDEGEVKKQVDELFPETADEINRNCIKEKDTAKDTAYAAAKCLIDILEQQHQSKEDMVHKWRVIIEGCSKSTGLDKNDFLEAVTNGSVDEKVKSQALCLGLKMKLLDNNGKPDVDEFKKQVKLIIPETADEINENCIKEKDAAKDTAYAVTKCVIDILQKHNRS